MSEEEQNKEQANDLEGKLSKFGIVKKFAAPIGKVGIIVTGFLAYVNNRPDIAFNAFWAYVAVDYFSGGLNVRKDRAQSQQEKSSSEVKYENKTEDDKTYS